MKRLTIWTPGRVGSTSVWRHLQRHLRVPCVVLHSACRSDRHEFGSLYDPHSDPPQQGLDAMEYAKALRVGEGETALVMTREPLARALSAWRFFDKFRRPFADLNHAAPLGWYDDQVRAFAGLDFLDGNFPRERGWEVRVGRHRIGVVRLEDAERVLPDAVEALCGIRIPAEPLPHLVRTVPATAAVPMELLRIFRESRWAQGFYGPGDVDRTLTGGWR